MTEMIQDAPQASIDSTFAKSPCGCNEIHGTPMEYNPTVNGDIRFKAQISQEEFTLKVLQVVEFARTLKLDITSLNINQW